MKFVTGRMIKESVEDVVRSIADDKNVNLVEAVCRSIYNGKTDSGENIYDKYQYVELGEFVADRLKIAYERAQHLPHYTRWKTPLKFLFTNINSIDINEYKTIRWEEKSGRQTFEGMKFEIEPEIQEAYNRERTLDAYLKDIENDFESYYENIYESVKRAPQNLKYDLYYLLLYRLQRLETDIVKYSEEEIEEIEMQYGDGGEEVEKLDTPFKFRAKDTKRCMVYTKELLSNERFTVPMGHVPYIEESDGREYLVLEDIDIGVQLAGLSDSLL